MAMTKGENLTGVANNNLVITIDVGSIGIALGSCAVPNAAVSQYLYLLYEAFQGKQWQSLLGNLRQIETEDCSWIPPRGRRSIRDIVDHVGDTKLMYHNHAFGDGQLTWDQLSSEKSPRMAHLPRRSIGLSRATSDSGRALLPWTMTT
jgi:DinB superfamily